MSDAQAFSGWAMLELMGHRQRVGFVREVEIAGGKMLRIDMPIDGADDVTEFYGGAAVYSLRPCGEDVARDLARRQSDPRPVRPVLYRTALPMPDDDDRDERPF